MTISACRLALATVLQGRIEGLRAGKPGEVDSPVQRAL
jgi:hypothetical protein